jgi:hypothetical protein
MPPHRKTGDGSSTAGGLLEDRELTDKLQF